MGSVFADVLDNNDSSDNTRPSPSRGTSMYIDASNLPQQIFDRHIALKCAKCEVFSSVTAVSIPRYELLVRYKPKYAGIVYRCDSCNHPVFLRFAVKGYAAGRVDLSSSFEQIERPLEEFDYTYVSHEIELLFREALTAYSNSCFNAFASMCRRTVQTMFAELGDNGRLIIFDQLSDIRDMAELEEDTHRSIEKVLFDNDADRPPNMPILDFATAGVLLEVMKDLLYETYVRKGKLQEAMLLRRQGSDFD